MKILQVNSYETPGRRFNGLAVTPLLKKYDVHSKHLVWDKDTDNPDVLTFGGQVVRKVNRAINIVERGASMQAMLHLNALIMTKMNAFKEADLIHLHNIHSNKFFSLAHLHKVAKLKPTVWTLHDPWAMTGHCVYPIDCKRWVTGCGNCPDLKRYLPLLFDTTDLLFKYKKNCYKNANFDIIVASKWMKDMVEQSPIFDKPRVHHIPFGLDLDFFSPSHAKAARKRFNITDNTIVISFRAVVGNQFKGLPYIMEALELISTEKDICIITTNSWAHPVYLRFKDRFRVIEFEWLDDEILTRDIMAASDIFLMPSIAEAFGLMAIEALACGKPIIVFEGTALPSVTFAPDVGIAVPAHDSIALYKALQNLIDNDEERNIRSKQGRIIAETHYDQEGHVRNLIEVYKMVEERWKKS